MDIKSAVILVTKEGKYIYRQSEMDEGIEIDILPTNTLDCCLMISKDVKKIGKQWNPNLNDLIATDWEVH